LAVKGRLMKSTITLRLEMNASVFMVEMLKPSMLYPDPNTKEVRYWEMRL